MRRAIRLGSHTISINDSKALKARYGLKYGQVVGVSDELSIVEVDNRGRKEIGACREVDDGRREGAGIARLRTASVAAADGQVYGSRVISHTVAW